MMRKILGTLSLIGAAFCAQAQSPPEAALSPALVEVPETAGIVSVTARVDPFVPADDLVVTYTVGADDDSATADADADDYTDLGGGAVTIVAGETSATILIRIDDDDEIEALRERFTVSLVAGDRYTLGAQRTATVVINEGVCDVTPQVRDAYLREYNEAGGDQFSLSSGTAGCSDVAEAVTYQNRINISGENIARLKALDFSYLRWGEGPLDEGTEPVFEILLNRNQLTSLPEGIFRGQGDLRRLSLHSNRLRSLSETVFRGLHNLKRIQLENNQLNALPAGIFSGLGNLELLFLQNNPAGTFRFELEFEPSTLPDDFSGSTEVRLVLAEGAPRPIEAILSVTNGTLSSSRVALATGSTRSDAFTVTRDAGDNLFILAQQSLELGGSRDFFYNGFRIVSGPALIRAEVLSVGPDDAAAVEGATAEVTLTLDQALSAPLTVGYVLGVDDDPATADADADDYTDLSGGTVTIAAGETSATILIRIDDDEEIEPLRERFTVSVTSFNGYSLASPSFMTVAINEGVCDRTPAVRDEIMFRVFGSNSNAGRCHEVDDLSRIVLVSVAGLTTAELQERDLAGLTGVTTVALILNPQLMQLPERLFSDLDSLMKLDLSGNVLTELPPGLFAGLENLEELRLDDNQLSELPTGLFAGLYNLRRASFGGQRLVLALEFRRVDHGAVPGSAEIRLAVVQGAPFEMTAGLSIEGGMASSGQVTIPTGGTASAAVAVTQTDSRPVVVGLTEAPQVPAGANYAGLSIAVGGPFSFDSLPPTPAGLAIVSTPTSGDSYEPGETIRVEVRFAEEVMVRTTFGDPVLVLTLEGGERTAAYDAGRSAGDALVFGYRVVDDDYDKDGIGVSADALRLNGARISDLSGNVASLADLALTDHVILNADGHKVQRPEVEFSQARTTASEGGSVELLFRVSSVSTSGFSVFYSIGADGDASTADADDYTDLGGGAVTIAAGETTAAVLIRIDDDDEIEPPRERFTVSLVPDDRYTLGTQRTATVVIKESVCDRTPVVRDEIMRRFFGFIPDAVRCRDIADLAGIPWVDVNKTTITELQELDFAGLTGLYAVRVNSNSSLTWLPGRLFSDQGNLQVLSLGDNALTELPLDLFDGLDQLDALNLNDNQLSELPADMFSGFGGLQSLNLSGNMLSELPPGVFSGLGDLLDLRLQNNRLMELPPGVFSGLDDLQELRLQSNRLNNLPEGVFSSLGNLEHLRLESNRLNDLPESVFSSLGNLEHLRLASNRLNDLPEGVFSSLGNLEHLRLESNRLNDLPEGVFSSLGNLEHLRLASNRLNDLPEGVFSSLGNLEYLRLESNDLTALPAGMLSGLHKLRQLWLNDNPGAPFKFELEFKRVSGPESFTLGPAEIQLTLREGAPFPMVVHLAVEGGTLTANRVTLGTGSTQTASFVVSLAEGTGSAVVSVEEPLPQAPETVCDADSPCYSRDAFKITAGRPFVLDNTRPASVAGLEIISPPQTGAYLAGRAEERITVAIAFDESVVVIPSPDGRIPLLLLEIGDVDRNAAYDRSASATNRLVFSYVLGPDDRDGDGISVSADALRLNGASIIDQSLDNADLLLDDVSFSNRLDLMVLPVSFDLSLRPALVEVEEGGTAELVVSVSPPPQTTLVAGYHVGIVGDTADAEDYVAAGAVVVAPGMVTGRVEIPIGDDEEIEAPRESFTVRLTGLVTNALHTVVFPSSGKVVIKEGVCDRTGAVRNEIVARIAGAEDCADVIAVDLAAIETLFLAPPLPADPPVLSALKAKDFEGLSGLEDLSLERNNLPELPAGVFSGLGNLRHLFLFENRLNRLSPGLFLSLGNLEELSLRNNQLEELPAGVFSGLDKLESLLLSSNELGRLPAGTFAGLTALTRLHLQNQGEAGNIELVLGFERAGAQSATDPDADLRVTLLEGAPFDAHVELSVERALPISHIVTLVKGSTRSEIFTLRRTGEQAVLRLVPPALPIGDSGCGQSICYQGFEIVFRERDAFVLNTLAPRAIGVTVTSTPARDGAYATGDGGETITAEMYFNEEVVVTTPAITLALEIGDLVRFALYRPELSSTDRLIFTYAPTFYDFDPDGISIASDALALNGARIMDRSLSDAELSLGTGPYAILNAPGHKVRRSFFEVSYAATRVEILEGEVAEVVVSVSPRTESAVTVAYVVAAETASTADYTDVGGGVLTIAPNSAAAAIRISIIDDEVIEPPRELFKLLLSEPGEDDGYVLVHPSSARVVIKEGVCDRTAQVRGAITAVVGAADCAGVTGEDLAGLDGKIDLSRRDISVLKEDDFSGLANLRSLYLHGNNLRSLPDGVFSALAGLHELLLQRNKLDALRPGVFSDLSASTNLNLSGNRLSALPPGVFSNLARLQSLDLDDNRLDELPAAAFPVSGVVDMLSLSNNRIGELSMAVLSRLTGLRRLFLDGNRLSGLPRGMFAALPMTLAVDLTGNPGAPFGLRLTFERVDAADPSATGSAQVRLTLAEGAPFDVPVTLETQGGEASFAQVVVSQITISKGSTQTGVITVTWHDERGTPVVVMPVATMRTAPSYGGVEIVTGVPFVLDDSGRAEVSEVEFVSMPEEGGAYRAGDAEERITVGVRFDEELIVFPSLDGPSLTLVVGDATRTASYDSGASSTDRLVFSYTPTLDDLDADGVSVVGAVALNGARVIDRSGIAVVPSLGPHEISNAVGHAVEPAVFGLSLSPAPVQAEEAATAEITVHITPAPISEVFVRYAAGAPGDASAEDYVAAGTVTVAAGATTAVIQIFIVDDEVIELPTESFTVSLIGLDNAAFTLGLPNTAQVVIRKGVCERTAQIRQAIMDAAGVAFCAAVTAADLARIETLLLNDRSLTSLKEKDFDGLVNLRELNLRGNEISGLPARIFSGLSSLSALDLSDNLLSGLPVGLFTGLRGLRALHLRGNPKNAPATVTFTLNLHRVDATEDTTAVIAFSLREGAPFEVTPRLTIHGGNLSDDEAVVPAGTTESKTVSVTRDGGDLVTVTPVPPAPPVRTCSSPPCYTGFEIVASAALELGDDAWSPLIIGLEIVSDPIEPPAYAVGETIRVVVKFSEQVIVTDPDALALVIEIGDRERPAEYDAGLSTTNVLVFSYRVAAADFDADGVSVTVNSIFSGLSPYVTDLSGIEMDPPSARHQVSNAAGHGIWRDLSLEFKPSLVEVEQGRSTRIVVTSSPRVSEDNQSAVVPLTVLDSASGIGFSDGESARTTVRLTASSPSSDVVITASRYAQIGSQADVEVDPGLLFESGVRFETPLPVLTVRVTSPRVSVAFDVARLTVTAGGDGTASLWLDGYELTENQQATLKLSVEESSGLSFGGLNETVVVLTGRMPRAEVSVSASLDAAVSGELRASAVAGVEFEETTLDVLVIQEVELTFTPSTVGIERGRSTVISVSTRPPLTAGRSVTVTLSVSEPGFGFDDFAVMQTTAVLTMSQASTVVEIHGIAPIGSFVAVGVTTTASRGVSLTPAPLRLETVTPRVVMAFNPVDGLDLAQGDSATVELSLDDYVFLEGHFAKFAVATMGSGLQVEPEAVFLSSTTAVAAVVVSASQAATSGTLRVTAESGVVLQAATVTLPVHVERVFNLAFDPAVARVVAGASTQVTITLVNAESLEAGETVELGLSPGAGLALSELSVVLSAMKPSVEVEVSADLSASPGEGSSSLRATATLANAQPIEGELAVTVLRRRLTVSFDPEAVRLIRGGVAPAVMTTRVTLQVAPVLQGQERIAVRLIGEDELTVAPPETELNTASQTTGLIVGVGPNSGPGVITAQLVSTGSSVGNADVSFEPLEVDVVRGVNLILASKAGEDAVALVSGNSTNLLVTTSPTLTAGESVEVSLSTAGDLRFDKTVVTLDAAVRSTVVELIAGRPGQKVEVVASGVGSGVGVVGGATLEVATVNAAQVNVVTVPAAVVSVEQGRRATFAITTEPLLGAGQSASLTLTVASDSGLSLGDGVAEATVTLRDGAVPVMTVTASPTAAIGSTAKVGFSVDLSEGLDVLSLPSLTLMVVTPRVTVAFDRSSALPVPLGGVSTVTLSLEEGALDEGQSATLSLSVRGDGLSLDEEQVVLTARKTTVEVVVGATGKAVSAGVLEVRALQGVALRSVAALPIEAVQYAALEFTPQNVEVERGRNTTFRVQVVPALVADRAVTVVLAFPDGFSFDASGARTRATLSLTSSASSTEVDVWSRALIAAVAAVSPMAVRSSGVRLTGLQTLTLKSTSPRVTLVFTPQGQFGITQRSTRAVGLSVSDYDFREGHRAVLNVDAVGTGLSLDSQTVELSEDVREATVVVSASIQAATSGTLRVTAQSGVVLQAETVTLPIHVERVFGLSFDVPVVRVTAGSSARVSVSFDVPLAESDEVAVDLTTGGNGVSVTPSSVTLSGDEPEVTVSVAALTDATDSLLQASATPNQILNTHFISTHIAVAIEAREFNLRFDRPSLTITADSSVQVSVSLDALPAENEEVVVDLATGGSGVRVTPSSVTLSVAEPRAMVSVVARADATGSSLQASVKPRRIPNARFASTQIEVAIEAREFNLRFDRPSLTITADSSVQVSVSLDALPAENEEVVVDLATVGSGVRVTPSSVTLSGAEPGRMVSVVARADATGSSLQASVKPGRIPNARIASTQIEVAIGAREFNLRFDRPSLTITAGSSAQVSVSLDASPAEGEEVIVDLATGGSGVRVTPSSVTLSGAEPGRMVSVVARADATESSLQASVKPGRIPNARIASTQIEVAIGAREFNLRFDRPSLTITADSSAQVSVSLDASPAEGEEVIVDLATGGSGVRVTPSSVTLSVAEPGAVVSVAARADATGSSLQASVKPRRIPNARIASTQIEVAISAREFNLRFDRPSLTITADSSVQVSVSLDALPAENEEVVVDLATGGNGVRVTPSSVTLSGAEPRAVVSVVAGADATGSSLQASVKPGRIPNARIASTQIEVAIGAREFNLRFDRPSLTITAGSSVQVSVSLDASPAEGEEVIVDLATGGSGVRVTPSSVTLSGAEPGAVVSVAARADATGSSLQASVKPGRIPNARIASTQIEVAVEAREFNLRFDRPSLTITADSSAQVSVSLDALPAEGEEVIVDLTTGGNGVRVSPSSVTLSVAEPRAVVSVAARADATGSSLQASVKPGRIPNARIASTQIAVSVEAREFNLRFDRPSLTITADSSVQVSVSLDASPAEGEEVIVDLATGGSGVRVTPPSVTLSVAEPGAMVSVAARADATGSSLQASVKPGRIPNARIASTQIAVSVEAREFNLRFDRPSLTITAGSSAQVSVSLDALLAEGEEVIVDLATVGNGVNVTPVAVTLSRSTPHAIAAVTAQPNAVASLLSASVAPGQVPNAEFTLPPPIIASVAARMFRLRFDPPMVVVTAGSSANVSILFDTLFAQDEQVTVALEFITGAGISVSPSSVTLSGVAPRAEVSVVAIEGAEDSLLQVSVAAMTPSPIPNAVFFVGQMIIRTGLREFNLRFDRPSLTITAGSSARVSVSLDAPLAEGEMVTVGLTSGDARLGVAPSSVELSAASPRVEAVVTAQTDAEASTLRAWVGMHEVPNAEFRQTEIPVSVEAREFNLRFDRPSLTITADSSAQVSVSLDALPAENEEVVVDLATGGNGVRVTPSSVTLSVAEPRAMVSVAARADATGSSLQASVKPGRIPNARIASTQIEVAVEVREFNLRFDRPSLTITAGSSVVVSVSLDALPADNEEVVVDLATGGNGVRVTPSSVTLSVAEPRAMVSVAARADATGSSLQASVKPGRIPNARIASTQITVAIEARKFNLRFDRSSLTITAGSSVRVSVSLDASPAEGEEVIVDLATGGSGVSVTPSSVTLSVAEPRAMISVVARVDATGSSLQASVKPGRIPNARFASTQIEVAIEAREFNLRLDRPSLTITAGSSVRVSVSLDAPLAEDEMVMVGLTSGDARLGVAPSSVELSAASPRVEAVVTAQTDAEASTLRAWVGMHEVPNAEFRQTEIPVSIEAREFNLRFDRPSLTITAGSSAQVSVSLDALPAENEEVVVDLATGGSGVSVTPSSVTLSGAEPRAMVSIVARVDATESSLQASVKSGRIPNARFASTQIEVSIEAREFNLRFDRPSLTITAGSSAQVSVSLDALPAENEEVVVDLATGGSGVGVTPSSVTLSVAEPRVVVSVVARADATGSSLQASVKPGRIPNARIASTQIQVAIGAREFNLRFDRPSLTITAGSSAQVSVSLDALPAEGEEVVVDLATGGNGVSVTPVAVTLSRLTPHAIATVTAQPNAVASSLRASVAPDRIPNAKLTPAEVGVSVVWEVTLAFEPAVVEVKRGFSTTFVITVAPSLAGGRSLQVELRSADAALVNFEERATTEVRLIGQVSPPVTISASSQAPIGSTVEVEITVIEQAGAEVMGELPRLPVQVTSRGVRLRVKVFLEGALE